MTTSPERIESHAQDFRDCFTQIRSEISRVYVGPSKIVNHLLVCFFCQGHGLIEGAPGLGKTLLVRTLSQALDLRFARIQCTPDLMPADITGTNLLLETQSGLKDFAFRRGALFANIVLADEINRATPRTQSAFLEAMQERQVTVLGQTYTLDPPFSVFATQNPIEMEGTYPLPEAQLDRFFFKLTTEFPEVDDLVEIMNRTTGAEDPAVRPQFGAEHVSGFAGLIKQVKIADPILRYLLRLVRATHPDTAGAPAIVKKFVRYGASPRGAQAIILASKTMALLAGRYHVATEDILEVVAPALAHRVILNFQAQMEQVTSRSVIDAVRERIEQP